MVHQEEISNLEEKVFELEKKLESKNQEILDLANIASVITSILDIEAVLAVTMETAIRHVAGEVGAILLLDGSDLVSKIAWGVDSSVLKNLKYLDDLDVAQYCLQKRITAIENNCRGRFSADYSIRSFIAVPIVAKERAIGVVIILNKEEGGNFDQQDKQTLEMICRFASVAIENTNLLNESLEKQKMEQELNLARQVQTTFLPEETRMTGFKIASVYAPAWQVGGDYYDIIPIAKGKLFFLLGDVTHKGLSAALVMTAVYSIIRAFVTSEPNIDIKEIMGRLNSILCKDIIKAREMFITLFMAYVDIEEGWLEYCNGGHPPALFYRAAKGETQQLKQTGPLVGQFVGVNYLSNRIEIGRGDRILCYTDGLIEAQDKNGELYGLSRLERFFRSGVELDAEAFSNLVKAEIDRYSREVDQNSIDDLTILVIDFMRDYKSDKYRFTYPSHLESLERMYSDLDIVFKRHELAHEVIHPFQLAVSEAVTNAIVHAHQEDSSKQIIVSIELNHSEIIADIVDEGTTLGLDRIRQADLGGDALAESGRGIGLIRKLSDEAVFREVPGGGTEVRIVKRLNISRGSADGGNNADRSF